MLRRSKLRASGLVLPVVSLVIASAALVGTMLPAARADTAPATSPPVQEGRTLYVAAGAKSGSGSSAKPFATLNAALQMAKAGDTVSVAPGRYQGPVTTARAGMPGAPIVIQGWGARLEGDGSGRLVTIGHSYVTFEGFDVSHADKGIWVEGANHVRIVGNVVHDVGGECIRLKYRAVANEVAGNRIGPCGLVGFQPAGTKRNGEGVYIGTAPEQLSRNPTPEPDASDRNWVHDNTVTTAAECVDVKEGASRNVVEFNTCTGGQDVNGSSFDSRGNGNLFLSNTATGGKGAGIRLGGDTPNDGIGNTVRGNVLRNNGGYGIKLMRKPQATICGNQIEGNASGVSNDSSMRPAAVCPTLPPIPRDGVGGL